MTHIKNKVLHYFQNRLSIDDIVPYGEFALKIRPQEQTPKGKLVIVSSMTPNPKGAGKTTTTIGLADALSLRAQKAIPVLRQPSLGPVLGRKGGAAGGGKASLQFENQINFHFTGDIHAITSAHNAISAQIDNEIFFETELNIDKDRIVWPRCLDMNERALKDITIHYPTKPHLDHKGRFIITVASELMSLISISTSISELKSLINSILIGYTKDGHALFVKDLGITDAIVILLQPALHPNMTLTLEGTPALIHGGAFANIAHGTTTVTALNTALSIADYAICETGFGADLGFEKFLHLIATQHQLIPDHLVLVISIPMLRALSTQEGNDLSEGLENLQHHINWTSKTGIPLTIALNQFADTTPEEISFLREWCQSQHVSFAVSNGFAEGGAGCLEIADAILNQLPTQTFTPFYRTEQSLQEKISAIAKEVYGAKESILSDLAAEQLEEFKAQGWQHFPICIAKGPFSLIPKNTEHPHSVYVKSLEVRTGAQFIIVYVDTVIQMPALPLVPNAKSMVISDDGIITI